MNSLPPEFSPAGTPAERTIETALIRRGVNSMLNEGGGRFQLLTNPTGSPDGVGTPAEAVGPSPAQAES